MSFSGSYPISDREKIDHLYGQINRLNALVGKLMRTEEELRAKLAPKRETHDK